MFRLEAYDLPVGDRALDDERCTICGWSWEDIAEHEAGICCCPGDHSSKPPEKLR
ncbi:MAG TPA: hypothetical protein VLE97_11370 [Gaiellaceae bacterium]|nr:hypothetical protein [Gaiellaceae bacterium]